MPLVAVAAAVGAAGTIATVGIAAMSALEIVAAVGAIASGIGVVTGNEKLAKIGGVIGLAGGVGALAQNQGWLAGAADAAASGTETAASAATQGAQASEVVDAAGGNIADIAQGGADVGKAVESAAATPGVEQISDAAQGGGLMQPPAATALQAPESVSSPAASAGAPSVSSSGDLQTTGDFARWDRANVPVAGSASGGFLDAFNGIGKWMEQNKTASALGSQFIGGLFDDEKAAKTDKYEAESDMLRQQMSNMANMPKASLTGPRPPVFNTTPATYRPTGLMQKR